MPTEHAIWQISGGPATRSYADLFLRYGVALLGPGDAGRWAAERSDEEFEGGFIRRFADEAQIGDIFVLRKGLSKIAAVGIVASEYLYLNQFDDVNGWDLQHARRLRWCPLPAEYEFKGTVFGANPPRFARAWTDEVADYARRFVNSPPTHWQTAPLPALPNEEPALDEVPTALRDLVAQAQDFHALPWSAFGEIPTEDEFVAHFVVPLLRALGWSPERIAVKWRWIDVALFRALPRSPETCHLVIEAKRYGAGMEGALEQAKGYVQALGVPTDVLVTDGIRYRLYACERDFAPIAYANLARLKRSAVELFERLRRP